MYNIIIIIPDDKSDFTAEQSAINAARFMYKTTANTYTGHFTKSYYSSVIRIGHDMAKEKIIYIHKCTILQTMVYL